MTQKRQRVGALIAAVVFLVSALATSLGVIWLIVKGDDTNKATDTSQTQQNGENSVVGTTLENFTPVAKVDTLKVEDVTVGTGAEAKADSTVTVSYVGALASNGKVFDASPDGQPATFALNQVIKGWQEGLLGMKVGGVRKLYIPAADAYGDQSPSASIPPNSDLYFEVTLLNVQ